MSKKYLVHGGWVTSRSDGDRHYITPGMVASLYKVSPLDCIMFRDHTDLRGYTKEVINGLTNLYPRYDGDYSLETLLSGDGLGGSEDTLSNKSKKGE